MKNFEDVITRFNTIHERVGRMDGQKDRRTDTALRQAALMHSIARQLHIKTLKLLDNAMRYKIYAVILPSEIR